MKRVAFKTLTLTAGMIFLSLLSRAQPGTVAEANSSIGFLSGEKAGFANKLAVVKEDIRVFTINVLEPHNKEAAEQKRQLAELVQQGPADPYSQASVDIYNGKIETLNDWGRKIDQRKERETPKYVDMKTREAEYTGEIAKLESRIKELIRQYRPDCLDATGSIESIVNCWAIYWDGEGKRDALTVIVPGTRITPNSVPEADADAFKTYRNKQLDDINRGIEKIEVPPPAPPQKTMIERATEKAKSFLQDIINGTNRYKTRKTTNAVIGVRG